MSIAISEVMSTALVEKEMSATLSSQLENTVRCIDGPTTVENKHLKPSRFWNAGFGM
jgi:hypothetical protein